MKIERAMILGLAMTLSSGVLFAQEQTTTHESTTTTTTSTAAPVEVPVYNTKHQRHKDNDAMKEQGKADEAKGKAEKSHKVRKAVAKQEKADEKAEKAADPTQ